MAALNGEIKMADKTLIVKTREQSLKDKKESLLAKRPKPETPTYENGLVVHFKGLTEGNEITIMQLKEFLKEQADAQYVEYITGDTEGYVRCSSAEEATKLAESTKPFNDDVTLTYNVTEGETEKMFWTRVESSRKSRNTRGGPKKRRRY